mgnify:CR=1 FL=1
MLGIVKREAGDVAQPVETAGDEDPVGLGGDDESRRNIKPGLREQGQVRSFAAAVIHFRGQAMRET